VSSGDAVAAALAVLAHVKARCRTQDMRTPAVFAALDLLEARARIAWPFAQFRRSLACGSTTIRRCCSDCARSRTPTCWPARPLG
jgi:hypothetical protein